MKLAFIINYKKLKLVQNSVDLKISDLNTNTSYKAKYKLLIWRLSAKDNLL